MAKILSIGDEMRRVKKEAITDEPKTSKVLGVEWKRLVVGQDDAIDTMVPYINRFLAGLSIPDKTVGNFFLCGPTGMGKTKTVEALAKVLYNSDKKLVRINCGEYQMEHEIAKLIGSPPGYLGHRESAPEFNKIRLDSVTSDTCKLSIILWDEIEKAHQSVFKILLGMIDSGKLRVGTGDVVDLSKTVHFYTSNIGSREMQNLLAPNYGFDRTKKVITATTARSLKAVTDNALKKFAAPEFIGRLDETIVFKPLSEEDIYKITLLEAGALQELINSVLNEKAFQMSFSVPVLKFLTEQGNNPKYGARSLKRTINKLVYNMVTNAYLDGEIEPGDEVGLHMKGDEIIFKSGKPKPVQDVA